MPDLSRSLNEAVPDVWRVVDIDAIVSRGDSLRRRRRLTQAGGAAMAVAAVFLVMRLVTPPAQIDFMPPADGITETPVPRPTADEDAEVDADTDVGLLPPPAPLSDDAGAARRTSSTGPVEQQVTPPAQTRDAPPRDRPRADHQSRSRAPEKSPDRAPPDPPEQTPDGPRSCVLNDDDMAFGETKSCSFTASGLGGIRVLGSVEGALMGAEGSRRPRWTLDILRGEDRLHYEDGSSRNPWYPESCADDFIEPGDVVTLEVYREKETSSDGRGTIEVRVGDEYGCPDEDESQAPYFSPEWRELEPPDS